MRGIQQQGAVTIGDLDDRADPRRHHRAAEREGLEDGKAEPLVKRWKEQGGRVLIEPLDGSRVDVAQSHHARLEAELADRVQDRLIEPAGGAGQHQAQRRGRAAADVTGEGADDRQVVLARFECAHHQEEWPIGQVRGQWDGVDQIGIGPRVGDGDTAVQSRVAGADLVSDSM